MRRNLTWMGLIVIVAPALIGCEDGAIGRQPIADLSSTVADDDYGSRFDPHDTGEILGRVVWNGPAPAVPRISGLQLRANRAASTVTVDNPNAPQIESGSGGIAKAVVSIRGISPARSRPWQPAATTVTLRNHRIDVVDGSGVGGNIGVTRVRSRVHFESAETFTDMVIGRGAATFSLVMFPGQPRIRSVDRCGLIELTGGMDSFWLRGYLFVVDHPYYTRTNERGEFRFSMVPSGRFELVCWLPHWKIRENERDTNSGQVSRQLVCPPIEASRPITLVAGQTERVELQVSD